MERRKQTGQMNEKVGRMNEVRMKEEGMSDKDEEMNGLKWERMRLKECDEELWADQ